MRQLKSSVESFEIPDDCQGHRVMNEMYSAVDAPFKH